MNVRYHKWLEIEVTHTYFIDHICSVLNLVPTSTTAQILKNYQILVKRHANIFSFFVGLSEGVSLNVLEQFEGISDLYFQVLLEDNFFFNYTHMEFSNETALLFFSNLNKDVGATHLQKSQFANETDLVSNRPEIFNINITTEDTLLQVKTLDGTTIVSEDLSNSEALNYRINLSGQESGVYQLFLNDELVDTFFMSSERMALNTIGAVQLNLESLKNNYVEGLTYHIDFNARAVHRRYKLVLPSESRMEVSSLTIEGMENEQYIGPVKESLMGEVMVEVFTSDIALPLKVALDKHPQLNIVYTSELSNRTNELELKLPNPSIEQIEKNTNEGNEVSFFSSTIIYV